jgi:phospholipid transport system substrate-binding protein
MNPRLFCALLVPVIAGIISGPLAAAPGNAADAGRILRTATDETMAIIYDKAADSRPLAERVQPVMEKYFNFDALTRRAVGPGWRQLTSDQQRRVTVLLSALVIRNYCSHFDVNVRSTVIYAAPVDLASGRCELPTTLTYTGQSYAVAYRAELLPEGWRFYDVVVEGVSLVANYRAQIEPLFQKGGADAVIHALADKLAEPPSTK